jgi:hypothetical protein
MSYISPAFATFCALSQETDLSDGALALLADELAYEYDVRAADLLAAFDSVPAGLYSRLVVTARAAGAGGLA